MTPPQIMTREARAAAALRRAQRRLGPAFDGFTPGIDPIFSPSAPDHVDGLAVVTCHYNFADFDAPVRNLRRFLREMDAAGIPVYGSEIHLANRAAAIDAAPRWVRYPVDASYLLWQKEAALNAIVARLPESVRYVALVDADVRFERPDWVAASIAALQSALAVQPFSEAVWTDQRGAVEFRRSAVAGAGLDRTWRAHPGFAWVIRRDFWSHGPGLYPWCLTGAGDVALAVALACEDRDRLFDQATGERNHAIASNWLSDVARWKQGAKTAAVPGRIWHEWHGSRVDRRYPERHDVNAAIDVARHVELDEDGLVRWTKAAPKKVREPVAKYFSQRREDG